MDVQGHLRLIDACTEDPAQAMLPATLQMRLSVCHATQQQPLRPGSSDTTCRDNRSYTRRDMLYMAFAAHLPQAGRTSVSMLTGSARRHGACQCRWLTVTVRTQRKRSKPGEALKTPVTGFHRDEKSN